MTTPSNRYAELIFAEQPTALWSLDDTISPGILSELGDVSIDISHGTKSYAYGSSSNFGYYLADDSNNSFAKNSNIPMVYGASSVTTIYENSQSVPYGPSIILPAFGFLNELGRYKTLTFEMWLRIQSNAIAPRKIFGPIGSDDGLYVNDSFLVLKINDNIASHYVGQWGRPMLIDITISRNIAILLVNGEQVASLDLDSTSLVLPASTLDGKSQDWVGFYAYSDVLPIDIDCVAVYPTKVSSVVAKRRLAYGQAVEAPEITNAAYTDVPIMVDYPVAKYANNKIFPTPERWTQQVMDNISAERNVLTVPEYNLPEIVFQDKTKTLKSWYDTQLELQVYDSSYVEGAKNQKTFYKMNPDGWASSGHIYFEKLNLLSENVDAIYGTFSIDTFTDGQETLIKFVNDFNQYFEIRLVGDGSYTNVSYWSNIDGTDYEVLSGDSISLNTDFFAGISIQDFVLEHPEFNTFFANRNTLKVYALANENFENQFNGITYKIAFMNGRNLSKVSQCFILGISDTTFVEDIFYHFPSYALSGIDSFGIFKLDIFVESHWETYFPLTAFGKNVKNVDGSPKYDLDFIQFNIDYPDSIATVGDGIDTSESLVKTYVSFFDLSTDTSQNSNITTYTTYSVSSSRTLIPGTDWESSVYEVINDYIIYMPDVDDINTLGIKVVVEFEIPGIKTNPIALRSLELSSMALNYAEKTPVGTKYGKDIYPYSDAGYKYTNPYLIYKGSSPYIYLNNSSGLRLVGNDIDSTRGIQVPINSSGSEYYKVSLIQASIFSNELFPETETEIFRIKYFSPQEKHLRLMVSRPISDMSGKTGELYILDDDNNLVYDVILYTNGVSATDGADSNSNLDSPIIGYKEWVMVGIRIPDLLNYSNLHDGSINITGPLLVNNVADYQITPSDEGARIFYRVWSDVTSYGTWGEVASDFASWLDLEILESFAISGVDPEKTYKTYFGNNRIVIGDDITPVRLINAQYTVFKNVIWKTSTITPV